jgi:hypothetical protein
MTGSCGVDIAAGAPQWKHIGIETCLIYQVLKEEAGAVRSRISIQVLTFGEVVRREDVLLK